MTSPLPKLLPVLVAASLLASASPLRRTQDPPPPAPDPVLLHATQCLAAKKFLPPPPPHTEKLSFGSLIDEYSFPGKKVIYIVNFASPSHPNGIAFEVFIEEEDTGLSFNIQNNARFELSKKEMSGVTFIDPPQGGPWEEHPFASAIKKIADLPRTTILTKDLSPLDASSTCEAYNDKD
jgi:hypothetical protein